jgi:hypothetical protein
VEVTFSPKVEVFSTSLSYVLQHNIYSAKCLIVFFYTQHFEFMVFFLTH